MRPSLVVTLVSLVFAMAGFLLQLDTFGCVVVLLVTMALAVVVFRMQRAEDRERL
jgi:hypothetical protein